jgi:Na+-translocating ferredoxin:NAD+ oxidoreductase subunit B
MSLARVMTMVDRIDALLPQTQCGRCGYDACRPYAAAVAAGQAINRCPPGGEETLRALARETGRPSIPLDATCGEPGALRVARIQEAHCIGCTVCIQACPVDAIVGTGKRMHAVLSALCTGCERCIPPCPVDCIAMVPAGRAWSPVDASAARERHERRTERLARAKEAPMREPTVDAHVQPSQPLDADGRRAALAAAVARARERRRLIAVPR